MPYDAGICAGAAAACAGGAGIAGSCTWKAWPGATPAGTALFFFTPDPDAPTSASAANEGGGDAAAAAGGADGAAKAKKAGLNVILDRIPDGVLDDKTVCFLKLGSVIEAPGPGEDAMTVMNRECELSVLTGDTLSNMGQVISNLYLPLLDFQLSDGDGKTLTGRDVASHDQLQFGAANYRDLHVG